MGLICMLIGHKPILADTGLPRLSLVSLWPEDMPNDTDDTLVNCVCSRCDETLNLGFVHTQRKYRDDLRGTIKELETENNRLRAMLAKAPTPCVYCGIEDMTRCERGFPGCSRADDLLNNPDFTGPEETV